MVDRLKEFCKRHNVDFGSVNFTIGDGYIKYKAGEENDKIISSAFGVSLSSCTLSTDESDGMTVLTNNFLYLLSQKVRYVVFDDDYLSFDDGRFSHYASKMKFMCSEDVISTLNPVLAGHPLDAFEIMSDNKGKVQLKLPEKVAYIIAYDKVNDKVVECECLEDWKYDASTGSYAVKRKHGEYEIAGVGFTLYRKNGFEAYGIKMIKRQADGLCKVCVLCDGRVRTDVYALVKDFVNHPLCLTVRDIGTIFEEYAPLYIDLIPVSGTVTVDCERTEITLHTSRTAQMGITTLNLRGMLHSFSDYTVVYEGRHLHLDTISEMGILLSSGVVTACEPKFKMTFKVDKTGGVSVSSVGIVKPVGVFLRGISAEVCSDGLIMLDTKKDYSLAKLTDIDTEPVQMIANGVDFMEFSLFGTLSQIEQSYRDTVGSDFKTDIKLGIMR